MEDGRERIILREGDVRRALTRVAHEIAERNPQPGEGTGGSLCVVGIHRRGAFLARRVRSVLQQMLELDVPLGDLDISFYRDDVSSRPDAPVVHASHIDFDVTGSTVVIVDDVLFTGRSVRSALDALADFGRPKAIRLAVLVDRGGRELPIQPDFVGLTLTDVPRDHRVNVRLKETDGKDEISVEPRA